MEDGAKSDSPLVGAGRIYGMDVEPSGDKWCTISVKVQDDLYTVYLDREQLFQVRDSTFMAPGKAGLWTKADAATYFDYFQLQIP